MVQAVLMGDANAFGGLVRKYERPIFNLMYRSTGSRDTAADLTQDAFLKAYGKIHQYRPGRKFYSWLYTLAMNTVRDHLRQNRRRPETTHFEPESSARSIRDDAGEDVQSLFQIMRALPLKDREAVLMRYREGLQMKEIAERLNLSVSGAKMRVHRGLRKLQQAWKEAGHDE